MSWQGKVTLESIQAPGVLKPAIQTRLLLGYRHSEHVPKVMPGANTVSWCHWGFAGGKEAPCCTPPWRVMLHVIKPNLPEHSSLALGFPCTGFTLPTGKASPPCPDVLLAVMGSQSCKCGHSAEQQVVSCPAVLLLWARARLWCLPASWLMQGCL